MQNTSIPFANFGDQNTGKNPTLFEDFFDKGEMAVRSW
jgi:hypothetical protein